MDRRPLRFWLVLLLATLLSQACSPKRVEDSTEPEPELDGRVIARVNGEPITLADLQASLAAQPAFIRRSIVGRTALLRYFGDMITFTLLSQEAQRRGLGADPDVQRIVRQALVDRWLEDQTAQVDLSDVDVADLDARVASAPERYRTPALVTVVQMFVRDQERATLLTMAYRMCLASRVQTPQERVETLRRLARFSDSAGSEPTLGPLSAADADAVVPAAVVEAALAATEIGELLAPVTVEGGRFLFAVESREDSKPLDTMEARARARQDLTRERQEAAALALTRSLLEAAEIEVVSTDDRGALTVLRSGLVDTTAQ